MYIQLQGSVLLDMRRVVGIFDLDRTTVSLRTREMLTAAEKAGRVISATKELPRSFIVYESGDGTVIYLSKVSSATLNKKISGSR